MSKNIRELFQLALESIDTNTTQEIEYVFFIKLDTNAVTILEENAYHTEEQEQWEHHVSRPDGKKVTVRVRAVDDKKYILCSKLNLPNELGKQEVELPTTKEMFEHFKVFSNTGTRKKRFKLKAEGGLVWEVDVYVDRYGSLHPWAKVDLEVPNKETPIPPFPFDFDRSEAILTQPKKRSKEEMDKVDALFNEYNLSAYHCA